MTSLQLEDTTWLFVVTLLHAFQLVMHASRIGTFRRKYKISPPEMNGPPEFMRVTRCQFLPCGGGPIPDKRANCVVRMTHHYLMTYHGFRVAKTKTMESAANRQNDLEFAIPFEILLWTSGIWFNQVAAAAAGLVYLYARRNYTIGYIEDPEKRYKPFYLSIQVIKTMLALSISGLLNAFLHQYFGISLAAMLKKQISTVAGFKDEL